MQPIAKATKSMIASVTERIIKPLIGAKEPVELNIVTLGSPVTVYPPPVKGVVQKHFTLREGTEGVIIFGKTIGKVFYHSVHFSPDLPVQLIGFNSLHQYSKVNRHPDDNLKLVLDRIA